MEMTPLRLLIAFAAYQCAALPNTPLVSQVVPEIATSTVNEIRHLPANQIISFLQADDSQCRGVSTALKSEVNALIASDQAAFNALDTGANCPSTFQTEVDSAQTAVNNAQTAVDTATQAQAAATGSSAPITVTVSFTTTPSVDAFTATPAWQAAQRTYNAAVLTGATKQGELDEAKQILVTAQSTQTKMVKACRCTAKAKYDVAVAQAKPHEAPNAASWRKAEKVICALDATSPCPSNPPANPTPPTLPAEVASVSQCETTAPTESPASAPTLSPIPDGRGASHACRGFSVPMTELNANAVKTCYLKTNYAMTKIMTDSYWIKQGKTYRLGPCVGTSSPNYCYVSDGYANSDVDVCNPCDTSTPVTSIADCATRCQTYSGDERSAVAWVMKSPILTCPNRCGQPQSTPSNYRCKYTHSSMTNHHAVLPDSKCDHLTKPADFNLACSVTAACSAGPTPTKGSSTKCAGFAVQASQIDNGDHVTTCYLKSAYALTKMLSNLNDFPFRTYSIGNCPQSGMKGGNGYCFYADGVPNSDVDVVCGGGSCSSVSGIQECADRCNQYSAP